MFGSYLHQEGEDDSVSNSEFSLSAYAAQTKHHKRKLGSKPAAVSGMMPVRMGAGGSVKKAAPTPTRRLADAGGLGQVSSFASKLASIEEDEKRGKKDATGGQGQDLSFSDMFASMGLSTPRQPLQAQRTANYLDTPASYPSAREGRDTLDTVEKKVSPDSGSFTMSSTKTRISSSITEPKDWAGDLTDSLPAPRHTASSHTKLGAGPVRMPAAAQRARPPPPARSKTVGVQGAEGGHAARTPQEILAKLYPSSEQEKENLPAAGLSRHASTPAPSNNHLQPGFSQESTFTFNLERRLAALTGGGTSQPPPRVSAPATSAADLHHHHQPTPVKLPPAAAPATAPSRPPVSRIEAGSKLASASATAMPPPRSTAKDQVLVVRGKRYKVMKLLGKGGSSRVYEAFDEEKNIVVAIKRVELADADESQREAFINEINMLRKLQGQDRIIKLYDHENVSTETEELLYVVMEKGDTDLASLLKKYASNKELTPAMIKHYWAEMLHAVSCIHSSGIIHKDLKPANFMLVAGRLKLIDFGIASSIQTDMTSVVIDNQMGTFNYMSPESIQDISGPQFDQQGNRKPCIKISFKSDVWSLGCILYHLAFGKLPFADIKHPLLKLQAITSVDHIIQYPEEVKIEDPRLVSVIQLCLERDVRRRASVEQLLAHSYLTAAAEPVAAPAAPPKNAAVSQLQMLEQLEGILSPNTFKKTKEGMRKLMDG